MKERTQLELRIEKMFANAEYKNIVINSLEELKIKKELLNDIDFLIDTVMMNPNIFLKPLFMLSKITITKDDLDFTNCIKKYKLESNKQIIINSINKSGTNLKLACPKFRNDFEIAKRAVLNDGLAMKFCSVKLKNDITLATYAILNNADSYYLISEELKNDRRIIKTLLIKDPARILEFAYIDNYDSLIKEVIKENGLALKYCSLNLRSNKVVVTNACKNNIKSLIYASSNLLSNQDFLIGLSKKLKTDQIIYYADRKLQNDKQFIIKLIKEINFKLYFVEDILKDDIDVLEVAIESDIRNFEHASKRLKTNDIIILELIKKYGSIIRYADKELLEDETFMYKAILEYNGCIKYISKNLRNNEKFIEKIKNINNWCKNYIENEKNVKK